MMVMWLLGLLKTRTLTFIGTIAGIAITVGLIATLGAFMRSSGAAMTERATASVPVDWQVELVPGADPKLVRQAMGDATALSITAPVAYASVDGFEATSGGTVQVTGPGKVIGVEPSYFGDFPGNFRPLVGDLGGILIAQQTAANLHAVRGDRVTIHRVAVGDAQVAVEGIVDIPNADSLFQAVGAPPGAAPQAPPDNVLIIPMALWHELFDAQATARPDSVRQQIHARLDHRTLPADPEAAFTKVGEAGRNLELRVAGSALLANNLAAVLDTVREDALYSRVLFLFLGAPGAIVAILLTIAIAHSGAARRRRDQALVRLRGGSLGRLAQLAGAEALSLGLVGSLLGVAIAEALSHLLFGRGVFAGGQLIWLTLAIIAGLVLSLAAVLVPAWRDARNLTIASARMSVGADHPQLWERAYLDAVFLALAAIVYWRTAAAGYQIVLAPEGVAAVSVDYWAFLAPMFLWLGAGLLTVRIALMALGRARHAVGVALRPVAGGLSDLIAGFLARQRRRITVGIALTALAFAFATSTAIFNSTYQAQARVDAELTNGSDVTVTGTAAAPAGQALDSLRALPGVTAAEPMQHRFAYVGTDLQDLYGIDPVTIGRVATMSNAYFANGDAAATLRLLKSTPDGVLVSAETVTDFQLSLGDTINLRLQSATDHQYHPVPFHFVGVVREFPTAPRDSFLVANADYVSRAIGNPASEVVLMRVNGDVAAVRDQARRVVAHLAGVQVEDIAQARQIISSSLTAVDLGGLTRLELAYALALVAASAGLVLALGVLDRRRTFAVLSVLGAKPVQLRAFLWSEGLLIFAAGAAAGLLTGAVLAAMLVKLLTGVFDPPPESLTVPWPYLGLLVLTAFLSVVAAVIVTARYAAASSIERLRATT
jgi:putative ABC transport system permease protein